MKIYLGAYASNSLRSSLCRLADRILRRGFLSFSNVLMLPRVVIFDLDHTLWPFRVDKDSSPPFHEEDGRILDTTGKEFKLFPNVHEVLDKLNTDGYTLGVASRIENTVAAHQLLSLFRLRKYFSYIVVYPGTKINHFKDLKMHTGVDFQDMLFFDDDRRNIRDISRLGVPSIQVENGVTMELLAQCMSSFSSTPMPELK